MWPTPGKVRIGLQPQCLDPTANETLPCLLACSFSAGWGWFHYQLPRGWVEQFAKRRLGLFNSLWQHSRIQVMAHAWKSNFYLLLKLGILHFSWHSVGVRFKLSLKPRNWQWNEHQQHSGNLKGKSHKSHGTVEENAVPHQKSCCRGAFVLDREHQA